MTDDRHSRWPGLLLILGAGVVSAFQVGKAPAALAAIQNDLALGLSTASWLLSAFALVGAVAGVIAGVIADNIGARRLVIGGLILQGLASAPGALSETAGLLLATRVAEGLGFLAVSVAAPALIVAIAAPVIAGRAIAVWGTFMPVGMTLVMLAAPLLPLMGWRGYWLGNAAILIFYASVLAWWTRNWKNSGNDSGAARRSIGADMRRTLATVAIWQLAILMAGFGAAYFAVIGFLPIILSERLSIAADTGTVLSAFVVAVNAVGNLAAGWLISRGIRHSRVVAIGFVTMAVCGYAILAASLPGPAAYLLCLIFSAVSGLIPVALLHAAPRLAPDPGLAGASVGFTMQGNNVGLVAGPALAGALAASTGWTSVALGVGSVALAGALLALARLNVGGAEPQIPLKGAAKASHLPR